MKLLRTLLLLVASSFSWICLLDAHAVQQLETKIDESDQEKVDWILEVAKMELQNLIRSEYDLKIDFLRRHLNVEQKELGKVRIYAKSIARRQVRGFEESFERGLAPLVKEINGSTFSINEKRFTFDGEEEEGNLFLRIEININRTDGWGVLKTRRGNNSQIAAFESSDLDSAVFEGTDEYRASLAAFSDQQLNAVDQARRKQRLDSLRRSLVILIGEKLHLDDEQMAEMSSWVDESLTNESIGLDAKPGESLFSQVGATGCKNLLALEAPPFLNDVQKRAWKFLQNSPFPLGF